jgi:polyribonucleotide nucleotidyltransferase
MSVKVNKEIGGRILSLEAGKVAKQADGAVMVSYGHTIVLVTAVSAKEAREGKDFLPLTVDYQEMHYAAGKIPGGFFRREIGRPTEKEVLTSRLIDRPIRPLFPKGYNFETQIIATVLSVDQENNPDVLALIGASAALSISDIPFAGPIAGVRMGRVGGKLILNPTSTELLESDLNLIVAGSREAVVMVEGGGKVIQEAELLEAIYEAHSAIQAILDLQEELRAALSKPKRLFEPKIREEALTAKVVEMAGNSVSEALTIADKMERQDRMDQIRKDTLAALQESYPGQDRVIIDSLSEWTKHRMREMILKESRRIDGREFHQIRPVTCEVGILPRTHGTALFTRGETQALVVTTLGTSSDEQKIDGLSGESYKSFMLHYNFPPYCVGEVRMMRGPGRRDIGHGALAERALTPVLPVSEDFPYTVRIVSEVLESNGSSSMATVCGGSMALMDAGVPVKMHVAGIAMGLIKEGEQVVILSDIIGDEDHLGDMDFKVAGTSEGISAVQMDIKISGITREIMARALDQARQGRLFILELMVRTIPAPRTSVSEYAPKIITLQINPDKIREVIGPGGKVIRAIVAETGAKIDIEDSGRIIIASPDSQVSDKVIAIIKGIVREPEVGEIFRGTVKKIMDFGAFVEILPGTEGLIHISQLDNQRVNKVTDIVKEGDEVVVKVLEIDKQGKIRLSRKAALGLPVPEPIPDPRAGFNRG